MTDATAKTLERLAVLARLELSAPEVARLGADLERMLDYVGRLRVARLPDRSATRWSPVRLRDDVPGAALTNAQVLALAPHSDGPFVAQPSAACPQPVPGQQPSAIGPSAPSALPDAPELTTWSLVALRDAMRSGTLSTADVLEAHLRAIDARDPHLAAYLCVAPRAALVDAAAALQAQSEKGTLGLFGVPLAVKDNLCTVGLPTTAASRILEGYQSPYESTATARALAAGALVLGKTNLDELAMGSSTEHSANGPSRNPWQLDATPGGSSGGSAAAVAAGLCAAALGSDTGGSVRQPAAFCGVVGLKPTYGRVSRRGLIAFASSLDHVGVLARSCTDAAAVLDAIAGLDLGDATTIDTPGGGYEAACGLGRRAGLAGLRVGVPSEYFGPGVAGDVACRVRLAIAALADAGAELVDLSLPHTELGVAAYQLVAAAEASSNLARFDGLRFGRAAALSMGSAQDPVAHLRGAAFGAEVKRRILLGTFVLSAGYAEAYYGQAQRARALLSDEFAAAFARVDLVATPAAPRTAFRLGELVDEPLSMYMTDVCSVPANLAGLPALSVPCGRGDDGLPVGLQLIGPHLSEARLLAAGAAYEQVRGPFPAPGGTP